MQKYYQENYPVQNRSRVTYLLIGINLFVFIFAVAHAWRISAGTMGSFMNQLEDIASLYGLRPDQPKPLNLITSMFLHLTPQHLILNMLFLYLFGRLVEKTLGPVKFLIFYLGCGLAAELLHIPITYAFLPEHLHTPVPTLGASGAIAGVLGFSAIYFTGDSFKIRGQLRIPASYTLLVWLAWQLIGGIYMLYHPPKAGGVAYWAHIGGFLFGMWLAKLVSHPSKMDSPVIAVEPNIPAPTSSEPSNPKYHQKVAGVALQLGETERAISHYQKAIELSLSQNVRPQALKIYEEAVQAMGDLPLDGTTRYRIGLYLEEAGRFDLAALALEGIMKTHPEGEEAELSALKAAQIYLGRLGSPENAVRTLKEFLTRYPESNWRLYAEQVLHQAKKAIPAENSTNPAS